MCAKESRRQADRVFICQSHEEAVSWGGRIAGSEATMGSCCFGNPSSTRPMSRSRLMYQTRSTLSDSSRDRGQRPGGGKKLRPHSHSRDVWVTWQYSLGAYNLTASTGRVTEEQARIGKKPSRIDFRVLLQTTTPLSRLRFQRVPKYYLALAHRRTDFMPQIPGQVDQF